MTYALMTSGGKDAVLALDRLRRDGADVAYAVTLYDRDLERVRFHGVRLALIRAQAAALGLESIAVPTSVADYERDFESTLDTLAARGVDGVAFGNVHLADVRAWYEERTSGPHAACANHRGNAWSILVSRAISGAAMLSKILIIVIFLGIVASMGSALFFLIKDKGQSNRTLRALTVRIVVSIALFALLFVLWGLGLINPHGIRP